MFSSINPQRHGMNNNASGVNNQRKLCLYPLVRILVFCAPWQRFIHISSKPNQLTSNQPSFNNTYSSLGCIYEI